MDGSRQGQRSQQPIKEASLFLSNMLLSSNGDIIKEKIGVESLAFLGPKKLLQARSNTSAISCGEPGKVRKCTDKARNFNQGFTPSCLGNRKKTETNGKSVFFNSHRRKQLLNLAESSSEKRFSYRPPNASSDAFSWRRLVL